MFMKKFENEAFPLVGENVNPDGRVDYDIMVKG